MAKVQLPYSKIAKGSRDGEPRSPGFTCLLGQERNGVSVQLNLKQNLDNFEVFYDMLSESHDGLSRDQSDRLNAQMILLLSNHIGDISVLKEAFARARVSVEISDIESDKS